MARGEAHRAAHRRQFPRDVDAVLVTAAGCGSWMKGLEAEGPPVLDFAEYLDRLGLRGTLRLSAPLTVAYQDACHLSHAQVITAAPRRLLLGMAIFAALALGVTALANEPDGRVAFRYDWPDKKEIGQDATRLSVSVTALVDLADTHLNAIVPTGIDLSVRAGGRAPALWPDEGLAIGELLAGKTIVVDLDVAKPPGGGGIVEFVLQATSDGRPVHEGVGVPVGEPGTSPTLRNGAAEFPAAREEPAP